MNKNIFEIVEEVLRKDSKYISEDGKLLKAVVYSDVIKMDKELLNLLLSNEIIKERFFKDINGILVFDKQGFAWFIESKEFLPDSYTRYSNKIGLTYRGDFISKSNDVVLDFPYKDCVLEGGQDKDDQKRKEIFYNDTIASDEISRMLAPKVFTNAKRYTEDGVEDNITFDKNDNLLIKGNNLIALSSLLKRYEGKVKCIYIDPPYNTGSDSFNYNDSFNHSTWLTFMKNRLELAKRLLSLDGSIAISIDNYEIAYTMVLLDEIFGKENRKNVITIRRASVSGAKVINPGVVNIVEYVVIYSKDTNKWRPNRVFAGKAYDQRYNTFINNLNEGYEKWTFTTVLNKFAEHTGVSKNKLKTHYGENYDIELNNFIMENSNSIVRLAALDDKQISSETRELKLLSKKMPNKVMYQKREGYKDYYLLNGNAILFASDRIMEIDGVKTFSTPLSDLWDDVLPNDLHNEGGVDFKKGKKPEKLVKRIIELCSNEGDLILDYHLGSGTTTAVAHKMNRKYIGIEQMNYIETISLERMKKVLMGEERGISKINNWQGGGSFVYCELLENASTLMEKIQAASEETISEIKDEIYADERIVPYIARVDLKKADEEFTSLELEEKKKALISLVDKNKLYVNYSDMDDESYAISEPDKTFTKAFYEEG